MFARLHSDIQCILDRDPAARSAWEVLTCYPGLHAVVLHRWANACWRAGFKWFGRFISNFSRWITGIEIHPGAKLGERVFFDHGMGIVIGETAEIGDGCTIYHGVTLGGTSLYKGAKRHPTLGKDVVVGAGAKVLGGFTVGDGAKVGSNAVVTKPVPAGATAVGNPARIIQEDQDVQREAAASKMGFSAYGVTQNDDPLSQAMRGLIDNAASQEHQIAMLWQALEKMNANHGNAEGIQMPGDAAKRETFEAEKLNQLVGK
jgi:serine O-acetyltransferase